MRLLLLWFANFNFNLQPSFGVATALVWLARKLAPSSNIERYTNCLAAAAAATRQQHQYFMHQSDQITTCQLQKAAQVFLLHQLTSICFGLCLPGWPTWGSFTEKREKKEFCYKVGTFLIRAGFEKQQLALAANLSCPNPLKLTVVRQIRSLLARWCEKIEHQEMHLGAATTALCCVSG